MYARLIKDLIDIEQMMNAFQMNSNFHCQIFFCGIKHVGIYILIWKDWNEAEPIKQIQLSIRFKQNNILTIFFIKKVNQLL